MGTRLDATAGLKMVVMMSCAVFASSTGYAEDAVPPHGNLLRNAGFELDDTFNGAPMRQGTEHVRTHMALQKNCHQLPVEGWWVEGDSTDGVALERKEVHSGSRSLAITPSAGKKLSVFSAPEIPVPAGVVTLSAWLRTSGAKGILELEFVAAGAKPSEIPRSLSSRQMVFPETVAEWTRVQLTAEAPAHAAAVARVRVDAGRVIADDLQLETGGAPTPFNVRPEEWLSLSFEDMPVERLPLWVERDDTTRKLLIRNDSKTTVKGTLEIWVGPWSKARTEKVAVLNNFDLKPGNVEIIRFHTDHLKPDAYVLVPVLSSGDTVLLDGERLVDTSTRIGGEHSNHMLKSRSAIRFAIGVKVEPARIFGVGNGMLGCGWKDSVGDWSGGWPLALFAAAKDNGFVCGRGVCGNDDTVYLFAAAGVPIHRMENYGPTPKGAAFEVPGKNGVDIWNPEGMAFYKTRAEEIGKANSENPLIVSYQMANETFFPFREGLCATVAADAHFRSWCKKRHGDLATLNRRWGTAYTTWDEVEQPASARYADEIKNRPKPVGAAAIDWTASLGNITPEIHKRMLAVPGRGMDWMRWRTWSSLWAYDTFRDAARKHDHKTLYSSNLCWPDFWPQMSMPFFRRMDVTMLDCQYTAGLPRGLGNPMEMMEILEMSESNAPDKPLWGIEIYVQPQWPAEFAPFQNWGMVAHGMANNLVFAWGPFSDSGIPKETKAWEKPDAVPMWMLIDLDGTKLPAYFSNQRSVDEIKAFHGRFDGLSLRRVPTDVAFYVSRDTAEYISLETANKPWGSVWTRTRNNLAYLLRMNGITADFVDDETLPDEPDRFTAVIVPASYVLSQPAAEKLAKFARRGGTVILAGVSGVVDPWLNKYDCLGGPAWAELGWKASGFKAEPAAVNFVGAELNPVALAEKEKLESLPPGAQPRRVDESKVFKGAGIGAMPNAEELRNAAGTAVGWKRQWGKGKILAYGLFPDTYTGNPHPSRNLSAWMRQVIAAGGLRHTGRWNSGKIEDTAGMHGEGAPVVEVVVRVRKGKEAKEKFVFVLNQGGAGEGIVEVPVAAGAWQVTDALTGTSVIGTVVANGLWAQKMSLKPWEYRVFRLSRK